MAQKTPHSQALALYQWLAFAIGVIYLTVGVAGFFVASSEGFAGRFTSHNVFGLAIDPFYDVVHLSTGFLGVILWSTPGGARAFGSVLVLGGGAMFLYGMVLLNNAGPGVIQAINVGNWLHLLSAVAGLAVTLWPGRGGNATSPSPRPAR